MSNLPAIPEPTTSTLPTLLAACDAVVAWADTCDDLGTVREIYDRFAAIAEYLSRRDAAREANAAMRRLEVRIGQLLPPPEPVGRPAGNSARVPSSEIGARDAARFRKMAAHPEAVEAVIAESTEPKPASRRAVLAKIAADQLDKIKAAIAADARTDADLEAAEDAAFIASITPPDYDPTFDRFSAAVCEAIISAEYGIAKLAGFTADDIRRALDHPNPKVRDIIRPQNLATLAGIVAVADKFRELT